MDRFVASPPTVGGVERWADRLPRTLLLTCVLGLMLLGGLTLPTFSPATPGGHFGTPAAPAPVHFAPTAGVSPQASTHGDLVVGPSNSPYYIRPPFAGSSVYVEQGNISVLAGGTLIVVNETVDFAQFVTNTGTIAQRLGHLYWFSDQGKVQFWNSTVTTDSRILNAFPKLSFNISGGGQATLVHSSFQFAGWLKVYGAGSTLLLNSSNITRNPGQLTAIENLSLLHDTISAASISVGGGAHMTLWNSSILNTFRDNTTRWGMPGAAPVDSRVEHAISSGGGATWSTWSTPGDSENLTRAVAEPLTGGVSIVLYYSSQVPENTVGPSTFNFLSGYTFPAFHIPLGGYTVVALPQAVVNAVNAQGLTTLLNATGAYGQPSTLSVTLAATDAAAPVNITDLQVVVTPALAYNITASGVGTVLSAIDSKIDINWNLTPGSAATFGIPVPWAWASQKLFLENGAQAYLANLSVSAPKTGTFWNASAVLPDASSSAYFYRWVDFPVTGAGGSPLANARFVAFYSYDASQTNNATATALNKLASANADLNNYVNSWLSVRQLAGYGVSGPGGVASLLLASSTLSQATLPDGTFLGGYHVAVTLAGGGPGSTQWLSASTTPYPAGMTPSAPDVASTAAYPFYRPDLSIGQLNFTVSGNPVTPPTVAIGGSLAITALVTNIGTGPVSAFRSNLSYVEPKGALWPVVAPNQTLGALAAGASHPINFTWSVKESTTGLHGTFTAVVALGVSWNGGSGPVGGIRYAMINVVVLPSPIQVTLTAPTGTYSIGVEVPVNGTLNYSGSGDASINITAVAANGISYVVGQYQQKPGDFTGFIILVPGMSPGTYSINVTAYYNTKTGFTYYPAHFVIGGATSSTATPWWQQKILGLPLWLLIAIAAGAVAAALVALFALQRQARGKLVECGECGNLIPEDATVCPKCGAEFESDLVRCSRCGSTIPASSQVCPECAATLLGKPEEATRDPERQGYADFVERYRAESKKELGENYSEGAFWDWWKRQQSYLPFSQWKLQQSAGSRAGMAAPVESSSGGPAETGPSDSGPSPPPTLPPRRGGGAGGAGAAGPAVTPRAPAQRASPPAASAPPPVRPAARPPSTPPPTAAAAPVDTSEASPAGGSEGGMKPCQNCGKEIPPDYLVCPFCGAVTR